MTEPRAFFAAAIIALVTIALRFLPFLVFSGNRKTPKPIEKLGRALPYAAMGMLVVYCLKNVSFKSMEGFLPELIACAIVAGMHLWRRNTLLSILSGTICYMLLVQMVF